MIKHTFTIEGVEFTAHGEIIPEEKGDGFNSPNEPAYAEWYHLYVADSKIDLMPALGDKDFIIDELEKYQL